MTMHLYFPPSIDEDRVIEGILDLRATYRDWRELWRFMITKGALRSLKTDESEILIQHYVHRHPVQELFDADERGEGTMMIDSAFTRFIQIADAYAKSNRGVPQDHGLREGLRANQVNRRLPLSMIGLSEGKTYSTPTKVVAVATSALRHARRVLNVTEDTSMDDVLEIVLTMREEMSAEALSKQRIRFSLGHEAKAFEIQQAWKTLRAAMNV